MPDQSDVENGLLALVVSAVYPSGTGQPAVVSKPVYLYRGWPGSRSLDKDLMAGKLHVSIYPQNGTESNSTRALASYHAFGPPVPPTLVWTISGSGATLSGTVTSPQAVVLVVDGLPYGYAVQPGDSLGGILGALAAQIPHAAVTGLTLAVAGASGIIGRASVPQRAARIMRQQEQTFQISFWCPDPASRDAIVKAVDRVLAATRFFLAAGYSCRLRWQSSLTFDTSENALLYRRDLLYRVEYITEQEALVPQMLGALPPAISTH